MVVLPSLDRLLVKCVHASEKAAEGGDAVPLANAKHTGVDVRRPSLGGEKREWHAEHIMPGGCNTSQCLKAGPT